MGALRAQLVDAMLAGWAGVLTVYLLSATASASPPKAGRPLQIYSVDVEGGQATLFITPEKKSLMVDTGWPGFDRRDANRIVAAAKDAKISKIDFVLVTHYHRDHAGGLTQLVERIPVGSLIDHGDGHFEVFNSRTRATKKYAVTR